MAIEGSEQGGSRTPTQIARQACAEAKRQGKIHDFAVRKGGRATIYHVGGAMKTYTDSALDTLAVLKREGYRP